jgi:Tol biopolymer transport system component
VLFVDKPAPDAPVGVYGVDLAEAGSPTLIDAVIGFRSPDRTIVGTMAGDLVEFTQEFTNEVEAGESWQVNTGGNAPHFSPDASRILWSATDQEGLYDQRQSDLWLANLDGSRAIQLFSTYGGGFEAWFPDGQRLLLAGKIYRASPERTLFIYDLAQGRRTELFSHQRLRDIQLSPGGTWVALYVTFDDEEPALNGVWLVSTDGATQHKVEVLGFGAYRWQDDETLLYIPMRAPAEESMRLWAVEAATGKSKPLTDPAVLSFSIFNGDWSVSPDGRHIIFVNSADHNIWLITLP